jgi:hypothetical protein
MVLTVNSEYFLKQRLNLNSVNRLIFVMVKCGVLFEVRTEFLNNIYTSFGFKMLTLHAAVLAETLMVAQVLSNSLRCMELHKSPSVLPLTCCNVVI